MVDNMYIRATVEDLGLVEGVDWVGYGVYDSVYGRISTFRRYIGIICVFRIIVFVLFLFLLFFFLSF